MTGWRRRGASLMEVLVAVLVVAVGVLGVAGLQLESARNNRAAMERTLATLLATDLAERWRTNPQGGYATALGRAPPPFVDCLARSCAAGELATFDLAAWKCALGRWREAAPCRAARTAGVLPPPALAPGLPAGDGSFELRGGGMVITVAWAGAEAGRLSLALRR